MEPTEAVLAHRASWHYRGQVRPDFAQIPAEGQESVWDYPRPPRLEPERRRVEVRTPSGERIASSARAARVLETAGPPTVYLPPDDVEEALLETTRAMSLCEWKGLASPVCLEGPDRIDGIGWRYLDPFPEFIEIAGWYSFYPGIVVCTLGGERVRPQPGGYYGGWITNEIVGPVKGETGCEGL